MGDFIAWWTADRLTAAFTVVAGIAAVLAWITAAGANSRSSDADERSIKALEFAETANQLSSDSNLIAERANGIAVEANEIAKATQEIQEIEVAKNSERNNVVWEFDWDDKGIVTFINKGKDPAHAVSIYYEIDGQEFTEDVDLVKAGKTVEVFCVPMRAKALDDIKRQNLHRRSMTNAGYALGASMPVMYSEAVRVLWRTPLGKHSIYEGEHQLVSQDYVLGKRD